MSYFACSGSDEVDTSKIINSGRCFLTSLMVYTDGVNDVTVTLYDNTAASGTVVAKIIVTGANDYGGRIWGKFPRKCSTGIYGDLSGVGGTFIVEYLDATSFEKIT